MGIYTAKNIKINEKACCPFGSMYGFPHMYGFETVHELDVKSIVNHNENWTVRTICKGHRNDFQKHFNSEYPALTNKPKMFQKYLKLELECRIYNLTRNGVNQWGNSSETHERALEDYAR